MFRFPILLFLLTPTALISVAKLPGKQNALPRGILIPDQKLVLSIGEREILNDGRSLGLLHFPDQMSVVLKREIIRPTFPLQVTNDYFSIV